MRLPRDVTGQGIVKALSVFGYVVMRQTGSHIRMRTVQHGEHHVTIPQHKPLRVGTLASIVGDVADHFGLSRQEVANRLFS